MWPRFANMMRWARVRNLVEGTRQSGRVEVFDPHARDDAKRPQDYGYAAMPVDGQSLVFEIGGHTVIMRMDRQAERPQLAAYEVCVWHKEGHKLTLKAGGQIVADCASLVINASASVTVNTPTFTVNGNEVVSGTVTAPHLVASTDLTVAGQDFHGHEHGGVATGSGHTGTVI